FKMITWEMIKKLTENPEKEFVRKSDGLHIKTNEDGELIWDNGYQFMKTGHEWEELKQSVDFMTALKSRKFVKVEHELATYTDYERIDLILVDLADNLYPYGFAEVIENGKWYIQDEKG
ncbi:MAG TPA: hypothetical protein VFC79_00920, partial [Tissierellaceae bacterium]|nr:hypothetical protein [Tissierellaceae bacterium]